MTSILRTGNNSEVSVPSWERKGGEGVEGFFRIANVEKGVVSSGRYYIERQIFELSTWLDVCFFSVNRKKLIECRGNNDLFRPLRSNSGRDIQHKRLSSSQFVLSELRTLSVPSLSV